MITLYPLKEFRLPVTAECVSPEAFQGKSCSEIEGLKIWEGNKHKKLGELFKVEEVRQESDSENSIAVQGNVSKVRRIGWQMKSGEIMINGDVGMHLGEQLKGGKITVRGNVGSWAGSMMRGGTIEIHGDAGDYLGAPYRGSSEGMRGGNLIVHGNVGSELGGQMKKGLIKIYGSTGQFVGFRMHSGTIYVKNDCGGRAGACMKDGKIVVGGRLESVLPTFTIAGVRARVKIEENEVIEESLYVFLGDLAEHGDGKLYVSKEKNPHLSCYEKFL